MSLASNGTLSGTPTAAGAYNFTVTATDSSTGVGPYSGARAYSGTVAAGAPIAGAVSATVAYGSSANPITLNLSGGAATSVAVASAASAWHGDGQRHQHQLYADGRLWRAGQLYLYGQQRQRHLGAGHRDDHGRRTDHHACAKHRAGGNCRGRPTART